MITRVALAVGVSVLLTACGETAPAPTQGPTTVGLQPKGDTSTGIGVVRVVDGDTIHVNVDGQDVTVRMVGINTPETAKPDSPIECFGPEASAFARQSLTGRTITLEYDASQGLTDRYGRTLAYVWVEQPGGGLRMFNLDAVAGGYAEERQYGGTPFAWKDEFRVAEDGARAASAGMWGACDTGS